MARIYDKQKPYPSKALQDAIVLGTNQWSDSNELSTALSADLLTESARGVRPFKSGSWWYWFDFGDGVAGAARPMVWLRSFTKPQLTGGTPSAITENTEAFYHPSVLAQAVYGAGPLSIKAALDALAAYLLTQH